MADEHSPNKNDLGIEYSSKQEVEKYFTKLLDLICVVKCQLAAL